mgnify:CR=1 FL=1
MNERGNRPPADVVNALQANMPPELQFINEMLNAPTDFEAQQMLAEHGPSFGPGLAAAMDAVWKLMPRGSTPTCAMHTVAEPSVASPLDTTTIASFASIIHSAVVVDPPFGPRTADHVSAWWDWN